MEVSGKTARETLAHLWVRLQQTWSADFRHANVTTDDFIALSEEISGEELDDLFAAWLEDDEIPALP